MASSGIKLRITPEADIPTPAAGKVHLFADDDLPDDMPAVKLSDGSFVPLQGAPGADAPPLTSFDAGNSGAAYEFDLADGDVQELVLDDDAAITFAGWPTAPLVGVLQAWFTQPSVGGPFVPSFGAEVDWGAAGEPDWSTTADATDIVNFETRTTGSRILATLGGRPGPAGAAGADGTVGGAIAIPYTFSTTTTDSDPGAGNLRLSNTTQASATVIRADLLSSDGTDWSSVLATLDDSTNDMKGHIRLFKLADPTKWLLFEVAALASPAGYKNITVVNVGTSGVDPLLNGDAIVLAFSRAGDQGDAGTASVATDPIWDAAGDTVVGTGTGTAVRRKNNDAASAAPTVNDDSGDGYAIGSRWLDTTSDKEYVATDVTVAGAVWKETTVAGPRSGTWTPALTFGGGSTGLTYTFRSGSYYRLGNLVFATYVIVVNNKGSSTGDAKIGGLPFSMASADEAFGVTNYSAGLNAEVVPSGANGGSGTTLALLLPGATMVNATHASIANGCQFHGTLIYVTADA